MPQASYKKVITLLKNEEASIRKRLAQLNTDKQIYWDKYDMVMKGIQDVLAMFNAYDIVHKHRFINMVFDNSLTYQDGTY